MSIFFPDTEQFSLRDTQYVLVLYLNLMVGGEKNPQKNQYILLMDDISFYNGLIISYLIIHSNISQSLLQYSTHCLRY